MTIEVKATFQIGNGMDRAFNRFRADQDRSQGDVFLHCWGPERNAMLSLRMTDDSARRVIAELQSALDRPKVIP